MTKDEELEALHEAYAKLCDEHARSEKTVRRLERELSLRTQQIARLSSPENGRRIDSFLVSLTQPTELRARIRQLLSFVGQDTTPNYCTVHVVLDDTINERTYLLVPVWVSEDVPEDVWYFGSYCDVHFFVREVQ